MLGLKKLAVTGGLSSGKTTVCKIFESLGAYYVSADQIVHRLLSPKTKIGKEIIDLLGPEIVNGDQFDRAKIAEKVFSQKDKLYALEQILHPAVIDEIKTLYDQIKKAGKYALFVAEVPLLFESESEKFFDCILTVIADPETCKKRFHSKPGASDQEFEKRMARQWDMKQKAAKADFTLTNNDGLEELKNNATKLYQRILNYVPRRTA
ncbi:MAG TPA: dephospho-CoA kinase [Rhabdochlamydiaceae bacterium]|nr:dephospho-CoA kinase [Rhabdochlamydiaceae bacterium]